MRTLVTLALFIFALYTGFVAADDDSDTSLPAVVLKGAGATLPVNVIATGTPLTPSWINAFQTLTGGLVTSSYSPTGSGEGEVSILSRQVDYAVSSAPLSDSELLTANDTLYHFPILLGALDVTYFFPAGTITGPLNLTADILSGIFQGSIADWGNTLIRAVNPNLNFTGRIFPVARFDSAGATQVFTKYLNLATVDIPWQLPVEKKITWPRNVTVVIGDGSLVKAVGSTAGAIGYTNYGTATTFNLPSAAIRNADGFFVFPSQQTIKAAADAFEAGAQYPDGGDSWSHVTLVNQPGATSYPLAHYEYALFYKDQRSNGARGAALAAFMNFVVSTQAQASAPIFKYAPLGDLIRGTNIASINYMLIDDDYSVTSYWNPYPPPPNNEDHELVQGTIASLIVISIFGAIIIVGIVVFGFLEWRQNDIEFL